MEATQRSDTTWTVDSDSGSQYTVERIGPDVDDTAIYKCSCTAGQWGKICKHVREVMALAQVEG